MRKELLTLAVACLLCVPAFAADDEEPKGVSNIKEVGKVIRNPITIEATGGKQKMDVKDVLQLMDDDEIQEEPCLRDEEETLMRQFLRQFGSQERRYAMALGVLQEGEERGEKLGRKSISDRMALKGLRCTEQEVRTILKNLSNYMMVQIFPGRGGTAITDFGARALRYMEWEVLGEKKRDGMFRTDRFA